MAFGDGDAMPRFATVRRGIALSKVDEEALRDADVLVVAEIYRAREEPIPGVSGELVAQAARRFGHRDVTYVPDRTQIPEKLLQLVQPDDMVITLGAGDVWKVGEELLKLLTPSRAHSSPAACP